jgi:VWFA-related protein
VRDLELKDFELYDEGKLQTIRYFTRERNQPVVIGFLLDLSNANKLRWKEFQEAMVDLVMATLMPENKINDRYSGYLIGYSTEAELLVNTTDDPEKLIERVRKLKAGGGAAMYDAVYTACTSRTLIKGEPIEPRRVIIIVGDGHDNSSKKNLEEVVEIAQRNLVTIYGVSTVSFGFNSVGEANLTRLANSTGGRVVYPLQNVYSDVSGYLSTPSDEGNYAYKVGTGGYASAIMKGIVNAIASTAGEIQTQYILRYTPARTDVPRSMRKIEVRVKLPNVKVRAREGYYPFAP